MTLDPINGPAKLNGAIGRKKKPYYQFLPAPPFHAGSPFYKYQSVIGSTLVMGFSIEELGNKFA